MIDFKWPLDLDARELAYNFTRIGVIIIGGDSVPEPSPDPAIALTASIIADRWSRLRRRLIDGELLARGTHMPSGEFRPIDPYQWARQGPFLDVRNGDLVELVDHKPIVRWSGLSLIKPGPVSSAFLNVWPINRSTALPTEQIESGLTGAEVSPKAKRTKRSRPKADAVAKALKAHGLDQDPGGKPLKVIASTIAQDMSPPVRTDAEMLALIKAVERHYKRPSAGQSD
jgi:hypothetical protein